jgi:isoleucyl-tRNA synthetase
MEQRVADWLGGRRFMLVDTGGLFGVAEEPLSDKVRKKALEEARKDKTIGLSLDAQVYLHVPEKTYQFLRPYEGDLKSIFIVSSVTVSPDSEEVRAEVSRADGSKCERCWNYDTSVGHHPEHHTICQRCLEAIQV